MRLEPSSGRVLLLQNDVQLRERLALAIRNLAFDVVELTGEDELFDYYRTAASSYQPILPDVVVADVLLDGSGGIDACDQLRKAGSQVPFILLSPPGLAELHAAAVQAGAALVVDKPFNIEALATRVAMTARN